MTILYLIRCGQNEWLKQGKLTGQADPMMDAVGDRHREIVGEALKDRKVMHLYSSPMMRAVQTIGGLAGRLRRYDIKMMPGLTNMNLGAWQGLTPEQAAEQAPSLWEPFARGDFETRAPEGETLREVAGRSIAAYNEILEQVGDGVAAVCTHRLVLKAMICGLIGAMNPEGFSAFKFDPASITTLQIDNGNMRIVELNNCRHIRGENVLQGPADF